MTEEPLEENTLTCDGARYTRVQRENSKKDKKG